MAIKVQWGSGSTTARASLRPTIDGEQQLEFASSPWTALFLLLGAAAFSPALFTTRASAWRYVVFGIVVLLFGTGIRWAFWRERLTLDLVQRRYVHRHGYWPNIASDEGALDAIEKALLDVRVESGSRGGEIVTWIVSLAFKDAPALPVASFALESLAYQYLDRLAQRLRVPAIDRTTEREEKTAWNEVEKPLAARTGAAAPRRMVPPLPDGSRITLSGDAPERRIVLPRPGLRPSYFFCALVPLFPAWFTGTLYNPRFNLPFLAMAAVFAVLGAVACVLNKEVVESGDMLSFRTRLLGATLSRRAVAKRGIVDITLKPVPTRALRGRDEVQIRSASNIINLTAARLTRDDLTWLAAALQAMAAAG